MLAIVVTLTMATGGPPPAAPPTLEDTLMTVPAPRPPAPCPPEAGPGRAGPPSPDGPAAREIEVAGAFEGRYSSMGGGRYTTMGGRYATMGGRYVTMGGPYLPAAPAHQAPAYSAPAAPVQASQPVIIYLTTTTPSGPAAAPGCEVCPPATTTSAPVHASVPMTYSAPAVAGNGYPTQGQSFMASEGGNGGQQAAGRPRLFGKLFKGGLLKRIFRR